ncbi:MAG: glycosyltransferase [Thiobacillus sp.]|nr:glycosyltransferase [Thiobacillus sp.]
MIAPKVTIGMPVYNGEHTIRKSLDSILAQSYGDFELIVSDNASTDATETICREYCGKDARVIYVRQARNIGACKNFKFVLDNAKGSLFMWWAADDTRSGDFVECNVQFLEANPEYVASTSPNCMDGQNAVGDSLVTFSMDGDVEKRFKSFFDNCWNSHGIFYSLIRTEPLRACTEVGVNYFGVDWSMNLFLAARGKVGRVDKGLAVFGKKGISSRPNVWADYRCRLIHWIMPFYEFSLYSYRLASNFTFFAKMRLVSRLFILNFVSAVFQVRAEARDFFASVKDRLSSIVSSRACCRWTK